MVNMCAKYVADKHKHPQTQTQSPQFIQHRNDYIAWAVQILDNQRRTLAAHLQRIQTAVPWNDSGSAAGAKSIHVHGPGRASFMPPKIKRFFG
jgi:hypothetical protein